tara:strand:- start:7738 stop:8115 length:378 start_codon:yes stop_codon:yes gene_type:complete
MKAQCYITLALIQEVKMLDCYTLNGKIAVLELDLMAWQHWFAHADRLVCCTKWAEDEKANQKEIIVFTVFLGVNHNWRDNGAPLLFETMIFGGAMDGSCSRVATWEEAEKQHQKTCFLVRLALIN